MAHIKAGFAEHSKSISTEQVTPDSKPAGEGWSQSLSEKKSAQNNHVGLGLGGTGVLGVTGDLYVAIFYNEQSTI